MIILDTNVISELMRPAPEPAVVAWLAQISGAVAITAITQAEALAGLAQLPPGRRRARLETTFESAVHSVGMRGVLPFDDNAARAYAQVLQARRQEGIPISIPVAQIAAICLTHSATLATRNEHDFKHTGVRIVNPWRQ
ncbi:MAG: type II toxin-antitoxin system VapC family toxin [Propionibacteriaceae bacterium]|nr:type II toxin-antitoxin system VapC family toxin [Propionibacteriaceae bacterium]